MNSTTILKRVDPEKFKSQLFELAKTYRVICMNAQHYAEVRKYGRDQLTILDSEPTSEELTPPFHIFGCALGVQGVLYLEPPDFPEARLSDPSWPKDPNSVWALLVCVRTLDETLKVATKLGEPWIEVPIDF